MDKSMPFPRYYVWDEWPNGDESWRQMGRMDGYPTLREAKAEVDRMLETHVNVRDLLGHDFPCNCIVITKAVPLSKIYGGK